MKKTVILVIAAICAVCVAFGLAACTGGEKGGAGGEKNEHVHNYGQLVPEQSATCTNEGLQAHYYCSGCQTYFDGEKRETTLEDLKIDIDPTAHNYGELVPQVDAQCEVAGTKAYYHCEDCGKYFDDQKVETDYENLNIPAKDHNYGQLVPEQSATCTNEGLQAHYYCSGCQTYFDGEKRETTLEDLKIDIDPTAHKWQISPTESNKKVCSACGAKENIYNKSPDETKIYFGEYPQSEVTESGLKATLGWEAGNGTLPTASNANGWTDYNYYIGGSVQSYMWYIDVEYENARYRGVYFTSYRPYYPYYTTNSSSTDNSYQDDNGYKTGTAYWFKYEPIEWRILTQADGTALLMSNIILDSQQYYHENWGTRTIDGDTVYANNYKESDIRAWLNDTFYNTAFDELTKSIIQQTEVDNSASTTYSPSNKYACGNTNDNIFLLSYKDITNSSYGFSSSPSSIVYDTARQLKSTAYARSQGVYVSTESSYRGNGWWWLRSPYFDYSYYAYIVYYDATGNYYNYVYSTRGGVVPALRIKL